VGSPNEESASTTSKKPKNKDLRVNAILGEQFRGKNCGEENIQKNTRKCFWRGAAEKGRVLPKVGSTLTDGREGGNPSLGEEKRVIKGEAPDASLDWVRGKEKRDPTCGGVSGSGMERLRRFGDRADSRGRGRKDLHFQRGGLTQIGA